MKELKLLKLLEENIAVNLCGLGLGITSKA